MSKGLDIRLSIFNFIWFFLFNRKRASIVNDVVIPVPEIWLSLIESSYVGLVEHRRSSSNLQFFNFALSF
jgi:hypothetical protein